MGDDFVVDQIPVVDQIHLVLIDRHFLPTDKVGDDLLGERGRVIPIVERLDKRIVEIGRKHNVFIGALNTVNLFHAVHRHDVAELKKQVVAHGAVFSVLENDDCLIAAFDLLDHRVADRRELGGVV